jgi:hypothetical protein
MRLGRILALLGVLSLLTVSALFVRSAQRSLLLTAEKDVRVMSFSDDDTQIGVVPGGSTRQVVRCVDNKRYIRPVVEVEPRKFGFPDPPSNFRLSVHDTGMLSKPQFLGCGDV